MFAGWPWVSRPELQHGGGGGKNGQRVQKGYGWLSAEIIPGKVGCRYGVRNQGQSDMEVGRDGGFSVGRGRDLGKDFALNNFMPHCQIWPGAGVA